MDQRLEKVKIDPQIEVAAVQLDSERRACAYAYWLWQRFPAACYFVFNLQRYVRPEHAVGRFSTFDRNGRESFIANSAIFIPPRASQRRFVLIDVVQNEPASTICTVRWFNGDR